MIKCELLQNPSNTIHPSFSVYAQEVAVLLGGDGSPDQHDPQPVEVYMGHLSEPLRCPNTGEAPSVPDLPVPVRGASAVYLPGFGIYVCGGWNSNTTAYENACYKFNPSIST